MSPTTKERVGAMLDFILPGVAAQMSALAEDDPRLPDRCAIVVVDLGVPEGREFARVAGILPPEDEARAFQDGDARVAIAPLAHLREVFAATPSLVERATPAGPGMMRVFGVSAGSKPGLWGIGVQTLALTPPGPSPIAPVRAGALS